ncbi:hypothetical protein F5884DRAFT_857483 [Xylogone sp. PMI_703]|nr:hypothetical protein F5884DRAFT_857483 [Xylogone sp. PMI_703]
MASPNQVSWQSAYWSLPALALNSMLQSAGKVCGLNASLRIYLRSSPIVCAMDAIFILIRFAMYTSHGYSILWAAKAIAVARGIVDEDHRPEDVPTENLELEDTPNENREPGRFSSTERNIYLLYLALGVGVITQFFKLMACRGIPWTQVWGCFYVFSYLIEEVTRRLAKVKLYPRSQPAADDILRLQEKWVDFWERACGVVAIILQLAILASVDMKAIPPDPILMLRWTFIFVRFGAHFAVCLIHVPFMVINFDSARVMPDQHRGYLLMSILVPHIILLSTQDYRFSQLYFMISVIISYFSWMLYFFPATRRYVLLCENNLGGRWNVLAFDFFCRTWCFSVFWYALHYDPTGTYKPSWADYLG